MPHATALRFFFHPPASLCAELGEEPEKPQTALIMSTMLTNSLSSFHDAKITKTTVKSNAGFTYNLAGLINEDYFFMLVGGSELKSSGNGELGAGKKAAVKVNGGV